ncbi:cytochrome c oxidase assembly protein [Mesobaculum littorinae]|uniref:Cytochrome c oxidase assembly protein n=1 Tax=Mesobaculum littorinae TaxID=2486419 RepID=A0A438AJR0_9RHOB|nr:cytochrome c oxidase assembly protein [Mesobaculum littorinae]RVV98899.1 cytochrome c oxidase assembly protein [Mesobaculum littorinae]
MTGWILQGTYCGPAPAPGGLWGAWNLDPPLLAALALMALVLRRSPAGLGAVGVLTLAFVSPLCALSAALFSARVVHHVLLVAVAAPLLAAAMAGMQPRVTQGERQSGDQIRTGLARGGHRPRGGAALPFVISTALLWGWHLPAAYDLALSDIAVYWAMQLTLLGSATWFWHAVRGSQRLPEAVLWALAGLMQMGFLGAILTFTPRALYSAHEVAPLAWGLTPLGDQQLGGLIMWVPAALPYLAIIALAARRSWDATAPRAA